MESPMKSSSSLMIKNTKNMISEEDAYDQEKEESGWTDYLEDFSSSPSLVSDAAWNGPDNLSHVHIRKLSFNNLIKKNNNNNNHHHHSKFSYDYDHDLEDTASSPINSPKVSSMKKQVEFNYRRIDDNHHVAASNFPEKQVRGTNNFSELVTEEKNGENIGIDEFVDLRKRGLCLVPMSALMNFMG